MPKPIKRKIVAVKDSKLTVTSVVTYPTAERHVTGEPFVQVGHDKVQIGCVIISFAAIDLLNKLRAKGPHVHNEGTYGFKEDLSRWQI